MTFERFARGDMRRAVPEAGQGGVWAHPRLAQAPQAGTSSNHNSGAAAGAGTRKQPAEATASQCEQAPGSQAVVVGEVDDQPHGPPLRRLSLQQQRHLHTASGSRWTACVTFEKQTGAGRGIDRHSKGRRGHSCKVPRFTAAACNQARSLAQQPRTVSGCLGGPGRLQLSRISRLMGVFMGMNLVGHTGVPTAA